MPSNEKQIQFKLKNVQVTDCFFKKPETRLEKRQNYGFNFSFKAHFDPKIQTATIILNAIIYYSPSQKIEIGKITTKTDFTVKNFNEFFVDEDKVTFPKDFIVMLMSISYSTLRGIILEKSTGILAETIILPIINIRDLKQYNSKE